MPESKKVALPRQIPKVAIGNQEYVLLLAEPLRVYAASRKCKFVQRGPSDSEWVDAMDRYIACLFPRVR